ncbi:MAG: zinc ABC transporter substrate-binding protein [Rhodobacteraceae bacterium]|nr:zinc ABC transporter substrate-binding protein [Paracoccaceae bacterium]
MNRLSLVAACCICATAFSAEAEVPDTAVSIKPIHSLIAGVMADIDEPWLMLRGAASPHTYQFRPSEAQRLDQAELIVWIGENMETFLARPIENLGSDAVVITLHEVPGIRLLPTRPGGLFGDDDHAGEEEEDEHHDEEAESGHGDEEEGEEEEGHAEGEEEGEHAEGEDEDGFHVDEHADHGHEHDEFDMHIWLDPDNASRIVQTLVEILAGMDPDRATAYRVNADRMLLRIETQKDSLARQLEPVEGEGYIVFHDAYQYFERAFDLEPTGSVAVDPSRAPSAKRLAELRSALSEDEVRCVFVEPQFKPDLVETIVEGTGVRTATLDPLGVDVEPGPDAWFTIMDDMADAFSECLGGGT